MSHVISSWNQPILDPRRILFSLHTTANITQNFAFETLHPLLVAPSLLAIKLFGFLWLVGTYVKGYILKLLLVKVHIKLVRDIVEGVKFFFTRWRDSADVVE
jgi:hypothetical protein